MDSQNVERFGTAGSCDAVVKTLKIHCNNPTVVNAAAYAVTRLCEPNKFFDYYDDMDFTNGSGTMTLRRSSLSKESSSMVASQPEPLHATDASINDNAASGNSNGSVKAFDSNIVEVSHKYLKNRKKLLAAGTTRKNCCTTLSNSV
jgi:hypothetical protein